VCVTAIADGTASSGGSMILNTPLDGFVTNTQDVRVCGYWLGVVYLLTVAGLTYQAEPSTLLA